MVASGMALKYMASGGPRPEADWEPIIIAMLLLDLIGSSHNDCGDVGATLPQQSRRPVDFQPLTRLRDDKVLRGQAKVSWWPPGQWWRRG
jgi:hypothetical protein